ncbi:MAG: A/G-specific adenine glycosylase [Spirosomataceae bacterium]
MEKIFFAEKLINWYKSNLRDLPWRHTKNPYYIWLSEVILQQTRVAQGLPYYKAFVEAFPTVQDLAQADEQEVLRLWQGLGYYSRARNLHTTAKMVVENYGGSFPNTYQELLNLKGIGTYTAAAIASFAFGEKVAVLDGNVYRVLARVFGEETDISSSNAKKVFTELATSLLPEQQTDTYNQAIMEFGALYCTPASPQCMFCTFQIECMANATGKQAVLPIKTKKTKVTERFFHYLVFQKGEKIAMKQRKPKDVWEGMYDFYLIEDKQELDWEVLVEQDTFLSQQKNELTILKETTSYKHILSHQRIFTKFYHLELSTRINIFPEDLVFYSLNEVDDLPKSTLVNNFLKEHIFNN